MDGRSSPEDLEKRLLETEAQISDQERLQEDLRESEMTAAALMHAAGYRALLLDAEGRILRVNRRAAEGFGRTAEELVGRKAFDLFPPELARTRWSYHEQAVRTGKPVHYEDERKGRWLETRLQPVQDAHGRVTHVAVLSRDVTERRRNLEELRRHRDHLEELVAERTAEVMDANEKLLQEISDRASVEENLRYQKAWLESLVQTSSFGVVTLGREGGVVSCNQGFVRLFGFEEREILGKQVDDFLTCEHCRKDALDLTGRTLRGQVIQETARRHRKDGTEVDVEIYGVPVIVDGRIIGTYGLYREISELKAAEKALRESEELFRTFAEDAPFGMSIMNPDLTFEYFNPKFTEIFAYTLEDLPDKPTWFQKAYPDSTYKKNVREIWEKDVLDGMKTRKIKPRIFSVRCKGGEDKIIHFRAVMLRNGKQLMTYEDITARARAEEALRKSEEQYRQLYEEARRREELYRSLIQSSADAVAIYDLEGRVQYVSPAFTQLFGWTQEELQGRGIPFVPESEHETTQSLIRELLDHGTPCSAFETTRYNKDGELLQVSVSASRYDDHEGNAAGMLVMLRDISARKELEAQLSQASKMEAVGTLAGGIAHDFNNLLQAISGYTQLLLMGREKGDPDHDKLTAIENAAQRAGELTERLLIFSRKVESRLRPVDLNHEVEQVVKLLERTIPKMIQIRVDPVQDPLWINADPVQLEQVVMNIAVNARDAMPEGGTLTFCARNVSLSEEECRSLFEADPGDYALLKISDTGCGMEPIVQEHIFEPFFTTKGGGKGTGLGLSMVYGIVKNHGGSIACRSRPGGGTVFEVYFPVLSENESTGRNPEEEKTPPRGSERILLVDDEDSILEIGSDMLHRFGYESVTARSGEEALETFRAEKDRIDLVILDLNMPGIGGVKCLQALKKIDPDVKVVVATGLAGKEQAQKVMELGAAYFIPKPYRLKDMLKTLRGALDKDRG
ncbi:MAG: PAS domain S-box protein [Desulfobacteraceae bacterium]|jgi:PAS domain S-box-containing protein